MPVIHGTAVCPFCGFVNLFGYNFEECRCSHREYRMKTVLSPYYNYAYFGEGDEEIEVLIKEA